MLIEHVTMQGSVHETRHEIRPETDIVVRNLMLALRFDSLGARERRRFDCAYKTAAKRRDRRTVCLNRSKQLCRY